MKLESLTLNFLVQTHAVALMKAELDERNLLMEKDHEAFVTTLEAAAATEGEFTEVNAELEVAKTDPTKARCSRNC